MSHVLGFDHVGITVSDLDTAADFFITLGLEVEGRTFLEGRFLDAVCGLTSAKTEIVMLRAPGGGTGVELSSFVRPDTVAGHAAPTNESGLRSIAFVVDDIHAVVDRAAADGYDLVGSVGDYEGVWLMAYIRGPEGIIVAVAQRLT